MPDRVKCSKCGDEYAARGFGAHNHQIHDGNAESLDMTDTDDETDESGVEGGDQSESASGEDGGGGGGGEEVSPGDLDYEEMDEGIADHFDTDDTEVEGDADAGQVEDEVEDTEEESRYPYNCGNCGAGMEYLGGEDAEGGGKQCGECGEQLFWSKVEAP